MAQNNLRQPATDGTETRFLAVSVAPGSSGVSWRGDRCRKAQVVLIAGSPLRRACTLHLLRAHVFKRAQSFAHASDLRALGCIKATGPSVVILSAGMRSVTEAPIREQMQSLHRDLTSAPIIVMSDREEIEEICAAFQEGARGFIPTSLEPHLVIGAIRMVLAGVTFVPVNALMRPRRAPNCNTERTCPEPATIEGRENWPPRQLAVLRFLLQGKANKEIARALELEESTIKVQVRLEMRSPPARSAELCDQQEGR